MALVVSTSRKHFGRLLSYLIDRKLKQGENLNKPNWAALSDCISFTDIGCD